MLVREGSIIFTYDIKRYIYYLITNYSYVRSTEELNNCKYNINIYLDQDNQAKGYLYIDDHKTYNY